MHVKRCTFFCTSRRRHTRLLGDWSSDVCSSDLSEVSAANGMGLIRPSSQHALSSTCRSEERRVGKECRSRGSAYHLKKKHLILPLDWGKMRVSKCHAVGCSEVPWG